MRPKSIHTSNDLWSRKWKRKRAKKMSMTNVYDVYIRIEPKSANTNCPITVFKYQCTFYELLTERPIYYSNNNAKIETKTSPVMLMVCIFLYVLHLFYRIDCHYSNRKAYVGARCLLSYHFHHSIEFIHICSYEASFLLSIRFG